MSRYSIVKEDERAHQGVDLYAKSGTNTFAVMDSTVYAVGNSPKGYGLYVILKFELEGKIYYAMYAHLSSIGVKQGDNVLEGAIIGQTGTSGNAAGMSGPDEHLHFEINTTPVFTSGLGTRVNPLPFFSADMEVK